MLFTSPVFLFIFLPLFLTAYYLIPGKIVVKNLIALIASIFFFAWGEPIFVFFLLSSTYVDYKLSLLLTPQHPLKQPYKRIILTAMIIANVMVLIITKYANFIMTQVGSPVVAWLHMTPPTTNIPLILGISFITFHKISYLVDSYKGRTALPRNFLDAALYIFLFPQLIAGPIIRYHDIGEQIYIRRHTAEGVIAGFLRFATGLCKKVMLADPLSQVVDTIFMSPPSELSLLFAWGGIIAYSLQIYFDFSGYSDMAIGIGRMLGFYFPENFNYPYIARSITEFWQRWHISLSNWMRVYLYIPLGGNRGSSYRTYLNLWIVFLISGFWHGASWNFIVWGAYYGFFLSLERILVTLPLFKSFTLPNMWRQLLTLLIVMVGWVFFRAPSLSDALNYILIMFGIKHTASSYLLPWGLIFDNHILVVLLLASLLATLPNIISRYAINLRTYIYPQQMVGLQFSTAVLLIIVAAAGIMATGFAPFLYFRF